MELVLFFFLLILVGIVVFSVQCFFFFGLSGRPVLLAFTLSWKLTLGAIVGVWLLGFGAILLPTIWINAAIEPLPNYSKVRDIAIALIISTISAIIMYVSFFVLAWDVLG